MTSYRLRGSKPADRFGRAVVGLRLVILGVWIGGALGALFLLPTLDESGGQRIEGLIPVDSEAVRNEIESIDEFGIPLLSRTQVVQRNPDGLSPLAELRVFLRAMSVNRGAYGDLDDIAGAIPITNAFELFPSEEDATTAITYLFFTPDKSPTDRTRLAQRFEEKIADDGDGLVGTTGVIPGRIAQGRIIKDSLSSVEALTILLVASIVGIHFRSLAAPVITLLAAGIAYLLTVRVVPAITAQFGFSAPNELEPVIVVLLLGIVTDYSIFFLEATRRRFTSGGERLDVARDATASIVGVVFVAGLAVAAGTAALTVSSLDIFSALGPGLAITVLIALLVSITFIPACIAILGRFVFWPTRPRAHGPREGWVRQLLRKRHESRKASAVIAALSLVVLLGSAAIVSQMAMGFSVVGGLPPDAEPRRAARAASLGFAPGIIGPLMLVVQGDDIGERRAALLRLENLIEGHQGVAGVVGPEEVVSLSRTLRRLPDVEQIRGRAEKAAENALRLVISQDRDAARFLIVLEEPPLSSGAIALYRDLRSNIPAYLNRAETGTLRVAFSGDTAIASETINRTYQDLKNVAIAVFIVDLLILAIYLRALVAPFYLMIASMLGFATSLGLTTLLLQIMLNESTFDFFVPFAASVLLISLGSDYNIFLVGIVWRRARDVPVAAATAAEAPVASRAIGVAGITLAASFAILGVVELDIFRHFAVAMSLGLLVDTFFVRAVFVPALMVVFGETSRFPFMNKTNVARVGSEAE